METFVLIWTSTPNLEDLPVPMFLTRPPEPPANKFDPLRERLAALIPAALHPELDAVWSDVIHETAVACLGWFDLGKQGATS